MSFDITAGQAIDWVMGAVPYIFGLLILAYLIIGGVLDYHWRRYGVGILHIYRIRVAYVVCGVIFIGIMAIATASL